MEEGGKLVPEGTPVAPVVVVGLSDIGCASSRALLSLTSTSPEIVEVYGSVVFPPFLQQTEDEKEDKVKELAFKCSPSEETQTFGRSLSLIDTITFLQRSSQQPLVTFFVVNTKVPEHLASLLAHHLVNLCSSHHVFKVVLLSALHLVKASYDQVFHLSHNTSSSSSSSSSRLSSLLGSLGAEEKAKGETLKIESFPEEWIASTPVADGLLPALLMFLQVEGIETHCLVNRGNRVLSSSSSSSSCDDGLQAVQTIGNAATALFPRLSLKLDAARLSRLVPHSIQRSDIIHNTRMYS
ncbi:hypothetical protein QOT17_016926 [Balamuthia mandrillaris]